MGIMRQSRISPIFQALERRVLLSRAVGAITPMSADLESQHLPRYETEAEKAANAHQPQMIEVPSSPPTGPIDPIAEYDPMEGLIVSWTGSTAWLNNLAQIARYVTVEAGGRMYIAVSSDAVEASAITRLNTYNVNLDNVTFYDTSYNSIWARDYGPRYVYEGDVRVITDHEYNRNRPLDMVVYRKGGANYILMNNSSRGVMKLPADNLEQFPGITKPTEKQGVPYETIASLKGVEQLDRLDDSRAVLLVKSESGALDLKTIALP